MSSFGQTNYTPAISCPSVTTTGSGFIGSGANLTGIPVGALNFTPITSVAAGSNTTVQISGGVATVNAVLSSYTPGTPTITTNGATGIGSGSTVSITGSDAAGQITLNAGLVGNNGSLFIVTFGKAYPSTPSVVIWPANAQSGSYSFLPFVTNSTTQFSLNVGSATLGNLSADVWNYIVKLP